MRRVQLCAQLIDRLKRVVLAARFFHMIENGRSVLTKRASRAE